MSQISICLFSVLCLTSAVLTLYMGSRWYTSDPKIPWTLEHSSHQDTKVCIPAQNFMSGVLSGDSLCDIGVTKI